MAQWLEADQMFIEDSGWVPSPLRFQRPPPENLNVLGIDLGNF